MPNVVVYSRSIRRTPHGAFPPALVLLVFATLCVVSCDNHPSKPNDDWEYPYYMDVIDSCLRNPERVEELYLHEVDSLPERISRFVNLKKITLQGGRNVTFPATFVTLKKLEEFTAINCGFTEIPNELRYLPALSYLWIGPSVRRIPEWIGEKRSLKHIDFRSYLDSLPDGLWELDSLQELRLSNNEIESLSARIGNLKFLRSLFISSNRLRALPSTIGELESVTFLHAGYNRLTSIPASIGDMASLVYLHFGNNNIEHFPPEIAQCTHLTHLVVSGNPISEEEKMKLRAWLPNTKIEF